MRLISSASAPWVKQRLPHRALAALSLFEFQICAAARRDAERVWLQRLGDATGRASRGCP
jgi:hypothetical protein